LSSQVKHSQRLFLQVLDRTYTVWRVEVSSYCGVRRLPTVGGKIKIKRLFRYGK